MTYEPRHEKTSFLHMRKKAHISCAAAWFVSDLVGNPEDRFSHDEAHIFSRQEPKLSTLFQPSAFRN